MASETKAGTSRHKTSTDTKNAAPKTVKLTTPKTGPVKKKAATAAKPVKAAEKKPAEKKVAPKKPKAGAAITAEARLRHIETAAYYIAEQRGFSGGNPAEDWLAAEQQIDHLLLAGKLPA